MKFSEKYPQPRHRDFNIPQEIQLEPDVLYSHRVFPCVTCKNVTAYRQVFSSCPPVPCCSEECKTSEDHD